jgi:hypothetical protein
MERHLKCPCNKFNDCLKERCAIWVPTISWAVGTALENVDEEVRNGANPMEHADIHDTTLIIAIILSILAATFFIIYLI